MEQGSLNVLVWSDDAHGAELEPAEARAVHPRGMAAAIADALAAQLGDAARVATSGLREPEQGLADARLAAADVLVWWAHEAHDEVTEETAACVQQHVLDGLGLIVLHSGHHAKPFRRLMGTSCDLSWREGEDEELIWTVDPSHPIAAGVEHPIRLGRHEMYGELFDIPRPDALVFVSAFTGGEVFRSGCCFHRGAGRVFYFGPGHETHPVYAHPQVRLVLGNAVRWAAADARRPVASWGARERTPTWEGDAAESAREDAAESVRELAASSPDADPPAA